MTLTKRLAAEFLGTLWLVLGGCGSAVLAANFGGEGNPLGIGLLGVSLAFGLTVLTGAFGHISGGHFNPAVSLGLWAGGRFPAKDLLPYIVAQVVGAIVAGFILLQIARGGGGFSIDPTAAGAFASNGYGAMSPGGYSVAAAFLTEVADEQLHAQYLANKIVALGGEPTTVPAPVKAAHTNKEMLEAVGLGSAEELFESIPRDLRLQRPLNTPAALSEIELLDRFVCRRLP